MNLQSTEKEIQSYSLFQKTKKQKKQNKTKQKQKKQTIKSKFIETENEGIYF